MIDYSPLFQALEQNGAALWVDQLLQQIDEAFQSRVHGDLNRWQAALKSLPDIVPSCIDLVDAVHIGSASDLSAVTQQNLRESLQTLHPWRKGPFQLFGVDIDTEWRSDWKWRRLKQHIEPLRNRLVLDVGCGNGYYCWRMLGAGARMVIGIDPMLLNLMQYQAIRKLHGEAAVYVLPIGIEDMPANLAMFDTVFSMGVLYHRRSPIDHLLELKGCLRSGGQLVLETLVVKGGVNTVLVPELRYAQMRNVWFLPSCEMLMLWLRRCGFKNVSLCDVSKTTIHEQRSTEWMRFNSLQNYLNSGNDQITCEGLPAPVRAIITANVE